MTLQHVLHRATIFLLGLVVALTLSLWPGRVASAAESLAEKVPPGAVAVLSGHQWETAIERFHTSELWRAIQASPAAKQFLDSPQGRKLRGGISFLEAQAGKDLWTLTQDLLGDEWLFALYPADGGKPHGLFVIRTKSPEIVQHLREKLEPLVPLAGDSVTVTETSGGWRLANAEGVAFELRDRYLIISNQTGLLESVVAALQAPATDSLATSPPWIAAQPQRRDDAELDLWVDYDVLRQSLHQDRLLPEQLDQPLASLLLGGVIEYIAHAPCLTASLDLTEQDFRLEAFVPGKPENLDVPHRATLPPSDSVNFAPMPEHASYFAIARNWTQWYQHREQILTANLLPEFDKFETGLATFLPGKDFQTDILPLLGERLEFVTLPQSFSHLTGRPGIRLPSFALVIELEQPQEATDVLQLFFQTLTAVVNLNAGQEKRIPWVMSSESWQGVQVSFARYLQKPEGDDLPVSFNFQPASARVGNRFVLGSTLEVTRQLIDRLQQSESAAPHRATPAGQADWQWEVAPGIVADLLEANRSILEAKSVQSGKTPERARQEFDDLLKLLHAQQHWSWTSTLQPTGYLWRLQGGWK